MQKIYIMIYPNFFENKIGFDIIRQTVAAECFTPGGRRLVEAINFSTDFDDISRMLSETESIRQAILFYSPFPLHEYNECIDEILRISTEGTVIEPETLPDFKSTLEAFHACISYFRDKKDVFPLIYDFWHYDFNEVKLMNVINTIVDDKGVIKDNASAKLYEIRRKIISEQSRIDKQIAVILKSMKSSGLVKDDCEISVRNGRAVIPMPAANKRSVRGFIHDTSATGQTVYIEPDEVFDINNNVRDLYVEEKQEIFRILKTLTQQIRPDIPNLINMCNYLSYLDFLQAKANFAIKIAGVKPVLLDVPNINLVKAQHPLLYLSLKAQNRSVVPLNIKLDEVNRIVVVSGPNAGGKSIALKTVAVVQYMMQCGLLVPVSENSEIGVFSDIFIDIGDEQSIENDLSTYTSHLKNLKFFLENSGDSSLILIDEFGTGTEPLLGGAIAEATLEKLCELHVKGVITTHYGSIKKLAQELPGLQNAAMLFDTENIMPLFELRVGKPGSSYTFEIAKRAKFPEEILEKAASKSSFSQIQFERQLQEMEIEKIQIEKDKKELHIADGFLKEIIDKYTSQLEQIETNKKEIIRNAKIEAANILKSANQKIENAIQEIRTAQAEKEKTKQIRRELDKAVTKMLETPQDTTQNTNSTDKNEIKIPKKIRQDLEKINKSDKKKTKEVTADENEIKDLKSKNSNFEKLKKDFPLQKEVNKKDDKPKILKVGSMVKALNFDEVGEIVEIHGDKAKVNFGSINMIMKLDNLMVASAAAVKAQNQKPQSYVAVSSLVQEINERAFNFSTTLDVRGYRADEAVDAVKKYVDDAIMLHIANFSILHGRGNGILRKIVRDYLHSVKEVAFVGDERIELGGDGITVVKMV